MAGAYPSSRSRKRCAMRDCSDQISMKPGEAFWENRPPDSRERRELRVVDGVRALAGHDARASP